MTGYACVWYYRNTLTRNMRDFTMRGVVPLLGAVMLTVVFGSGLISYARPDHLVDETTRENGTILGVIMNVRLVGSVAGLLQAPDP